MFAEGKLLPRVDILALQEADKRTVRTGGHHVAEELAAQLDMNWAHAPAGIPRGIKPAKRQWWLDFEEPIDLHDEGDTGVALLSRFPLADVTRIDLPWQECPWRPRLAMAATVSQVRIFNAHVDPHAACDGQLAQLETIAARSGRRHGGDDHHGRLQHLSRGKMFETRNFLEARGYTTPIPTGTPTWRGAGLRMHADWIFRAGSGFCAGASRGRCTFRITGPSGRKSRPHEDHQPRQFPAPRGARRARRQGRRVDLYRRTPLVCRSARSDVAIEAVIASEELIRKPKASAAFAELSNTAPRVATVSEKLLESISYTKTPQGIVVLAQRPESSEERLTRNLSGEPLLVVLHQINNPVNVGAILRTAEAAGATGIITTRNTSDPFSPKSLRGAMGSAFRLPIWRNTDFEDVVAWCRERNISLVGTATAADVIYTDWDWKRKSALVLGPESTGLSDDELKATDQTVSIR